jgi:dUTP pyrophosphatase
VIIEVTKINKNAVLPTKKYDDDADYDLFAVSYYVVGPHQTTVVDTGISMAIPTHFSGKIEGRSGLGSKGITIYGGRIDCSYRGPILVIVHNSSDESLQILEGDRIAQLRIEKDEYVSFVEVENLLPTERGQGGLGSTGR